jgi:O-antigen/teichoic acid export membrane protein
VERLLAHQNWRHLAVDIIFVAGVFGVSSVLSFVYIILVGRILSGQQFGAFNALLGLMTVFNYFPVSLQLAATRVAALRSSLVQLDNLMRFAWHVALPLVVLFTIAMTSAGSLVNARPAESVLCALAMLVFCLGATAQGFLAGIGRIRMQAAVDAIATALRLMSGWMLMLAGFGVIGALMGYLVSYLVILALAWTVARYLAARPLSRDDARTEPLRLEPLTIATFVLAFAPFGLDQLFVQAFALALGGHYAALTTTSKLVFYCVYPIIAVTYARLVREPRMPQRVRLLFGAAVIVACVSCALAILLANFPSQTLSILFGARYAEAAAHVGSLAFATAVFSVSTLCTHALIAWSSSTAYLPSLIALAVGFLLFATRHDSLEMLVANQICVYLLQGALVLALLGFTLARSWRTAAARSVQ